MSSSYSCHCAASAAASAAAADGDDDDDDDEEDDEDDPGSIDKKQDVKAPSVFSSSLSMTTFPTSSAGSRLPSADAGLL